MVLYLVLVWTVVTERLPRYCLIGERVWRWAVLVPFEVTAIDVNVLLIVATNLKRLQESEGVEHWEDSRFQAGLTHRNLWALLRTSSLLQGRVRFKVAQVHHCNVCASGWNVFLVKFTVACLIPFDTTRANDVLNTLQ